MKELLTTLVVCLLISATAQTVRRDKISTFTIRGNIGIQKPVTSGRFAKSFAGLYEGNLSFNARVAGDLGVGLGYQRSHFKNNQFLRYKVYNAEIPYQTSMIIDAGYMRIGYDQFLKTNRFLSWALNTGYAFSKFTNVNNDTSALNLPIQDKTFASPYIQPEFTANFVMEQRLAFSMLFSYTFIFHKYDARAPRLNHFDEIQQKGNNLIISYFNFGFGFTVLLGD